MNNQVYEKIKSIGKLPSPNGVALELMRQVDDENSTIEQITATVASDPAIASRLLKLVNSPLTGASRTVASVSTAVKLLGLHTVKNLAVGFSLLSANRKGASKEFDFERFWSESLGCAVAARNLSDHFGSCAPDEAFTVGLLCRIGRLALATSFPQDYDAALKRVGTSSMPKLAEAERKVFGIDHNSLTAEMMADWRLADVFCKSVSRQDEIDRMPSDNAPRTTKIAAMLHLAGKVASVLAKPKIYREDLADLLKTATHSGFSSDAFTGRFDSMKEEWRRVAEIFSVDSKTAPSLREAHTRASRQQNNILLVDNDPLSLRLIGKYLEDAGYDVVTAANGLEALQLIHSEGCQIVITDWTMPEMDGLQLCRAIRGSTGIDFAYVLIITAMTDTENLAQAFDAGADDFLTKPCKREELLARLKAGARSLLYEQKVASQRRAIQKTNAELVALNQKLNQMATTDELTGLYNRREAMSRLEDHWAIGERQHQPLACMLLDIDHFKRCNDTHGHHVGDAVLRETAQILLRHARMGETVCRIGGEEFVVLCPGATAAMAAVGAERIRSAVDANLIQLGEKTLHVTISVGVAEKSNKMDKPDELLMLADEMLYAAKNAGRNRVESCGSPQRTTPHAAQRAVEDNIPGLARG
jgi:diguanylate cyclase (GGDEF)-like protein